jgi:uncharacterized protein (DUF3084 family)
VELQDVKRQESKIQKVESELERMKRTGESKDVKIDELSAIAREREQAVKRVEDKVREQIRRIGSRTCEMKDFLLLFAR